MWLILFIIGICLFCWGSYEGEASKQRIAELNHQEIIRAIEARD